MSMFCVFPQKVKVKDAHFPDVPEISLNLTLHPRSALARLPESSFSLRRTETSTFGVRVEKTEIVSLCDGIMREGKTSRGAGYRG